MESARQHKLGFPALVFWSLCCFTLVRPSLGQNVNQQECEVTSSNGTTEYQACLADAEALYSLIISPMVDPGDYTCGYGETINEQLYCPLDLSDPCSLCDASNETLSHPPHYSYDRTVPNQPTWWQSITWYNYPIPLEVNLTLSLNHTYTVNSEIQIVFQSSRPRRMILEKSSDYGQTWQPYQYYADHCDYFQMANADAASTPTEVICTERYSSGLQTALYSGGDVLFEVANRLALLTDSPYPEDFQRAYETATELRTFLAVTDLRLRLLYPATDGLEWTYQFFSLVQSYYAISNIDTFLIVASPVVSGSILHQGTAASPSVNTPQRCNCNLHGKFCHQANSETVCQCFHNTMGKNCEQCLPLYNNRLWQPGSTLPFPGGIANECDKCNCNEHSDSCTYSESLGRGMCNNCRDNTAGTSCELCISGYYRNISVLASSPNSCIECNCEPLGTLNNDTTCSQYFADSKPIGQCNCRDNVEGRACDMCVDQYYGLLLDDGPGTCKDCSCSLLGTINASNVCEEQAGACPCKASTDTRTCAECKDGYYGYPITETEECSACDCNFGGSTSPICNKVSGRCACRSNIADRQCSITDQGFYFEFLDSNSYDSWEADSDCVRTSSGPVDLFTGRGFQTCYQGNQVTFRGVSAVTGLADALLYRPAIRYTYLSTSPWQLAKLNIVVAQSGAGTSLCPIAASTPIAELDLSLPPGTATAWYASEGNALDRRCRYDFTLTLSTRGVGAQEIKIDSLVIVPAVNSFSVYTQADATTMEFYVACISNMTAIATRQSAIDQCQQFMFAVSAESNDGAVECDCDPIGTIGSMCRSYGGDCQCKSGVGGRRCDRCLPGFFDFTVDGCTTCNCDQTGSISLACDFNTGQCPCKSGIALGGELNDEGGSSDRQCRSCLANYYGFNSGGGCLACDCNAEGSLSSQCLETGDCPCKETITGRQCSNCIPGYFLFSVDGCMQCSCNPDGSTSAACHPDQGTCACKTNAQGAKCDQCRIGYFNLQPTNPDGCQPCFCYGHGSQCNAAPSYVASTIVVDVTESATPNPLSTPPPGNTFTTTSSPSSSPPITSSLNACLTSPPPTLPRFLSACNSPCSFHQSSSHLISSKSQNMWSATNPASLTVNPANLQIVQPPALPSGVYVYLLAPRLYLGEHLDLYSQRLTYTMKVDTGEVDNTTNQYLIVTGGRSNMSIYYNEEVFTPALTKTRFEATFYETNWRIVGEERTPTVTEFQEILSGITIIRIRASFGPGTASTFYEVSMDTARYDPNPEEYASLVTTVAQCSCDLATNTMGLLCEQCQQGTYRQNTIDTPFDMCLPCVCNGRASTCDPVTGVCQACQLGTEGDLCENCAANVQEPTCDRCLPDHYGFDTDLFGGACSPCNCNVTGTGGVTQCDMLTGQCPCTGSYGGLFCDSCRFNYYNYFRGCLPCDVCYDSISIEYAKLLLRSANLTDFVGTLWTADTSSTLGPFIDRLMAVYNQMLQLVERTNAIITEGDTLTSTVTSLNTTMVQLLASLAGAIKAGTETADMNLASIERLVGQANGAIAGVNQALVRSHSGLTSGDIQSAQSTLSQLTSDLASVQSQLSALSSSVNAQETTLTQKVLGLTGVAQTAVQAAEQALVTAQRAQSVHDNTTAHTAALVTKANEVTDLGQQTQLVVSEVKLRAQQAKTAGEEGTEAALSARIGEVASSVDAVIEAAMTKSGEAATIEAQAVDRQTANAYIIDELANTRSQTESLIADASTTLGDVGTRHDRASAANQSASEAVASSEAAFGAADEMLMIVQNFDSQSSEAQTAADAALLKQSDIETLSADTITKAMELRVQLTGVTADAQEGLSRASQALQTAQAEEQSIRPVSQRATQLASESITKLQDTSQTTDSVSSINATQLHPARAQCDAYSPDLQSLETLVTQASGEAQTATDQALSTRATVDRLLAEVRNIQHTGLTDLPSLMERIRQARAIFTQEDYAQLVLSLTQSVQEQQVWLETTQAQATEMQAQIEALESFRVAK